MRRRRSMMVGTFALAVGLLTAACGGGGGGNDAAGVATAGDGKGKSASDKSKKADPQQAGLNFARCMREHGVDMPDPQADSNGLVMIGPGQGPDGSGPTRAEAPPAGFQEADKACRHFLEDLIQDGGPAMDPKEQDRALKFARCMREHGVNMPDPDFSKGGVQVQIGDGFDPASETFKAAQKACGSLFGPAGGGAPAPGLRSGGRS